MWIYNVSEAVFASMIMDDVISDTTTSEAGSLTSSEPIGIVGGVRWSVVTQSVACLDILGYRLLYVA
jgi:hypothetical protein